MTYTPLSKLEVGTQLEQIFYVTDVKARKTKAQKPFTILGVRDASGINEIKIWGFDATQNTDLKPKCWVKLTCTVKEYQGRPDLTTERPPMVVPQPADISPYTNVKRLTDDEIEAHWAYLEGVMGSVEDPYIKEYLNVAFRIATDQRDKFKTGAASATNRGAYRGGLVEHVAKVMKNALHCITSQLESKYKPDRINRDIIIAAVMMHDIGKIHSYAVDDIEVSTTRCGYLIQHLPLSYAISTHTWIAVESNIRREVPEELKDHVNHAILAHHGQLEYGSPVKPMTIEAYIVHVADMTDSMTSNYAEDAIDSQPNEQGFVPGSFFSNRPLYVGNGK